VLSVLADVLYHFNYWRQHFD